MYRTALNDLKKWKKLPNRKPLVIEGARQVGKTWLMKEFGRLKFKNTFIVNFEDNPNIKEIFETDLDVNRIINSLSIQAGYTITPDTLLVFDEIQDCPKALTCLKYFCENMPQQPILAAGSLLGIFLHQKTSFPVGKVDFLHLYPLSFLEFLQAMGQNQLYELLLKQDFKMIKIFANRYIDLLKQYFYVGGMPAMVEEFSRTQDYQRVRQMQLDLLDTYEGDFSKYPPSNISQRIREVWHSIPSQLSKENKKFIYGVIREGARAKEYEIAIEWLQNSGLIYKVYRVTKPFLPLIAYQELNIFKMFLVDIGLLGALSRLDARTILEGSDIFTEFKGALTEQYVLQQFKILSDIPTYYWSSGERAEIDFVTQYENKIIPIESKATTNLRAKSLKSYCDQYKPETALRFSMADYKKTGNLYDIPLYMVELFKEIIK